MSILPCELRALRFQRLVMPRFAWPGPGPSQQMAHARPGMDPPDVVPLVLQQQLEVGPGADRRARGGS